MFHIFIYFSLTYAIYNKYYRCGLKEKDGSRDREVLSGRRSRRDDLCNFRRMESNERYIKKNIE